VSQTTKDAKPPVVQSASPRAVTSSVYVANLEVIARHCKSHMPPCPRIAAICSCYMNHSQDRPFHCTDTHKALGGMYSAQVNLRRAAAKRRRFAFDSILSDDRCVVRGSASVEMPQPRFAFVEWENRDTDTLSMATYACNSTTSVIRGVEPKRL
jgi:hypothetical protein